MNYKMLSGPFIGEILAEGQFLDILYSALDDDLQARIIDNGFAANDQGKEDYESSWDSEETDEAITMKPLF